MNIAVLTPLPPVRSGIAHYGSVLLPALAQRHEVTAVVAQKDFEVPRDCQVVPYTDFDAEEFDRVICQLGNNPHHEVAYREAMKGGRVIVLHDLVLHHLIVEATLARGNAEEYIERTRQSHGSAGAALARGRQAGFHGEIGNFLYPASAEVARRSQAVIVHNRYAGESLRRLGVETPIILVGHPHEPMIWFDRDKVREGLGFADDEVVIGVFGFFTAAKRPEVVFAAFKQALQSQPKLRLLIVGEPAPNIDIPSLAGELPEHSWKSLGYVADESFDGYLAAVDKIVNLRYPSAGETSGALIRIFAAGKPVAVSDYAQFAEYPEEVAVKIPFGPHEVESLAQFMTEEIASVVSAQEAWLAENASLDRAIDGYERALAGENDIPLSAERIIPTLPVLPELHLERVEATRQGNRWTVRCQLTNVGSTRLEAGVYGGPGYRVLAKAFRDSAEIFDRWIALPCDAEPGQTASVEFAFDSSESELRLELSHAIEGVPHFDFGPFATAELRA